MKYSTVGKIWMEAAIRNGIVLNLFLLAPGWFWNFMEITFVSSSLGGVSPPKYLCSTWQEDWEWQWIIYPSSSMSCITIEQTHGMHIAPKSWIPSLATVYQYLWFHKKWFVCSSSTIKEVISSSTWWGTAGTTKCH